MKGVDTVEMEDRLQGDLAVLRRIQGESSSNRGADGWARNIVSSGDRQINGLYRPATSSVSSSARCTFNNPLILRRPVTQDLLQLRTAPLMPDAPNAQWATVTAGFDVSRSFAGQNYVV